jgi:hypothetical protein
MTGNAQTEGVRPPSPTVACIRCRAVYIDDPDGRTAHRTVFGHQPAQADPTREDAT